LDIEIRTASNGAKSLDDVMRYLYNEFYKKGKNYAPADYQKISEMMAGKSLEDFFEKYVRGTAEIDYDSILKGIGLKLVVEGKDKKQAYLGANLVETDGKLTVRSLPSDTPAYQQGLNTDDQIVAIDGNRASLTFLQTYLSQLKPGDKVKLTIFRFDTLRELDVTLGEQANQNYSIVPVENPSDDQKRLYKQYLLADLE
ncbi:MAG: PDZ domain-containing protein, partial [Acidobacteriota bacterium]